MTSIIKGRVQLLIKNIETAITKNKKSIINNQSYELTEIKYSKAISKITIPLIFITQTDISKLDSSNDGSTPDLLNDISTLDSSNDISTLDSSNDGSTTDSSNDISKLDSPNYISTLDSLNDIPKFEFPKQITKPIDIGLIKPDVLIVSDITSMSQNKLQIKENNINVLLIVNKLRNFNKSKYNNLFSSKCQFALYQTKKINYNYPNANQQKRKNYKHSKLVMLKNIKVHRTKIKL
jgi:hypothetical protein